MPVTFIAFLIGSLSIIGLPPFAGSWSKWLLILASADTGELIIIGVLLVSSLLNVAYLMPLVAKGFFMSDTGEINPISLKEGPLLVWLPPALTALGCVILFFYAGYIQDYLMPLIAQ
jgi:multicomponent Na+:H+ antiporter subunit D